MDSRLETYYDRDSLSWRNRLVGQAPAPMQFVDLTKAVEAGRDLARIFAASHIVIGPSGTVLSDFVLE